MCECDFSDKKFLDAVVILHPVRDTSLMVLLGEYTYTVTEDSGHRIVLGNLRHKNLIEFDTDSVFEVVDNEDYEASLHALPVLEYLVGHPEDFVLIEANVQEKTLTWKPMRKNDRSKV